MSSFAQGALLCRSLVFLSDYTPTLLAVVLSCWLFNTEKNYFLTCGSGLMCKSCLFSWRVCISLPIPLPACEYHDDLHEKMQGE